MAYEYVPEFVENLYVQQQNGINTDCSFEFQIISETGETTKKVIHAHKLILSSVSDYFANNFKPEWERNQPIPVTNCEHSIFEKLIKAIYLVVISFDNLEEACKLYEAAHFYCIEGTLRLVRDNIIKYWECNKTLDISSVVNISFKYGDYKLKNFTSRVFAHNAQRIVRCVSSFGSSNFEKYPPDAINFFYQLYDLAANEFDLLRGLENYVKLTNIDKVKIQPAIDAIRFLSLTHDQINSTSLLSDSEKNCLLKTSAAKSKQPRKEKKLFHFLSSELQSELREKFSKTYCWICKEDHSVYNCSKAINKYRVIYRNFSQNYFENVEDNTKDLLIKLLKQCVSDNIFKRSFNIDEEIDAIYYV